jgi:hypothetical protein
MLLIEQETHLPCHIVDGSSLASRVLMLLGRWRDGLLNFVKALFALLVLISRVSDLCHHQP